jgi:2-polyprenyl-3-methyl-5-hydroxy-6-metoxy-1,4-benzoquinol methylase
MNHFKDAAKTWDNDRTRQRNRAFANALAPIIAPFQQNLRLLDFGCGTGLLSEPFAADARELLGIDSTKEMLDQFDQRYENLDHARSFCVNLEEQPQALKGKEFDIVISAMAFHHLKNPLAVLDVLKSALSPSGKICILDLDQEDGSFHADPKAMGVHHFGFSVETLNSWARELALKLDHQLVHLIEKNERTYNVFLAVFSQ